MDIDLLSRMVKELILDNDTVSLPGVGVFVAEMVPSTFSDKGYTINPPYRRLSFRPRPTQDDNSLIEFYSRSNNIEPADAQRIICDFLDEMKEVLQQKKTIIFPGLGRLRATRENNFFFVPDEDLDIYPAGIGLEPISLKTHEETPDEVSQALGGFKAIIDNSAPDESEDAKEEYSSPQTLVRQTPDVEAPAAQDYELPLEPEASLKETVPEPATEPEPEIAPEPVAEPEPAEEPVVTHEPAAEPEQEARPEPAAEPAPAKRKTGTTLLIILLVILVLALIALAAFLVAARLAPDWLDTILYTPEQLSILRGVLP